MVRSANGDGFKKRLVSLLISQRERSLVGKNFSTKKSSHKTAENLFVFGQINNQEIKKWRK